MKICFLLMAGILAQAASYQSLNVPAAAQVNFVVPNSTPFNTMGDSRFVFRIHNITGSPTSGSFAQLFVVNNVVAFELYNNAGSMQFCSIGIIPGDSQGDYGNVNCISMGSSTDLTIRYQRISVLPDIANPPGATGQTDMLAVDNATGATIQMICASGTSSNYFGCPLHPAASPLNLSGTGPWGNSTISFSVAWFKWFGSTVPLSTPLENEGTQADLADFRFDGSYTNQATTAGVTMSAFSGTPTFSASPILAPGCFPVQAALRSTFRAGQAAVVSNTSYTLDGSQPSYLWQEVSGPSQLFWNTSTSPTPTVTGGVAGTYNLKLTVTGYGGGGSTSCTTKIGFVATDSNNVITTGNGVIDTLLGPQIMQWSNPWAWLDSVHRNYSNLLMNWQQPGQYYGNAFWNTPAAGTVAFTTGSAIVTGTGTALDTLFCGSSGATTPITGAEIQLWNTNATLQPMKRAMAVASCQSATQVTLSQAWNLTNVSAVADCHLGGCSYNYNNNNGTTYDGLWISNSYYGNFYDAVAGLYAMYYRSGIDTYLTAARTLADNFWSDRMDSGNNYYINAGFQASPRNRALLGMVLRALDGRPDMWPGLENAFNFEINEINGAITNDGGSLQPGHWFNTDPRESGYLLEGEALCAIADTQNPTQQATCQAALVNAIENGMKTSRFPDGNWYTLQESGAGAPVSCGNGGAFQCNNRATSTSVHLTNGAGSAVNSIVLCDITGTTCPATANAFPSGAFLFNLNGTNYPACIWFLNSTSVAPASNSDGDATAYYMVEDSDGYHFHLTDFAGNPVNYSGTTGLHGWSTGNGACGFGVQPYMMGIMGTALDFAAKGLQGYSGGATAQADAVAFNEQMANFNAANSYDSTNGGMYYAVHYTNCISPIASANPGCTALNTTSQAGALTSEALRGIMTAYGNSSSPALKSFADKLYTQQWAKPGYSAPSITVDVPNNYNWDYNQWSYPQTGGLGNWGTGTPPGNGIHKYFGMALGIGAAQAWPGYRVGGLAAPSTLSITVPMNLSVVPNAASMQVNAISVNGSLTQATCAASPCTISLNVSYGGHQIWRRYLSASGAVLRADSLPIMHVQ